MLPSGILTDSRFFELYQRRGVHITPVHFYQPVPDTRELEKSGLWDRHSELPGIDLRLPEQVELLLELGREWIPEYMDLLTKEPVWRAVFPGADGAVLYSMIRKYEPNLIIEIGSGRSTLLSADALRRNGRGRIIAIDPSPRISVREALKGVGEFVEERVETVPLGVFQELGAGDILFIDSSHTVRVGGDVVHEICEIIPRLDPGVLVHLHDIFLPLHYPHEWVIRRHMFWAEQYLLQAFLAHNDAWRILWSAGCMQLHASKEFKAVFPEHDVKQQGLAGSFWMVREQ